MSAKIVRAKDVIVEQHTAVYVVTALGRYAVTLGKDLPRHAIAEVAIRHGAFGRRVKSDGEATQQGPFTYLTPNSILAVEFP